MLSMLCHNSQRKLNRPMGSALDALVGSFHSSHTSHALTSLDLADIVHSVSKLQPEEFCC